MAKTHRFGFLWRHIDVELRSTGQPEAPVATHNGWSRMTLWLLLVGIVLGSAAGLAQETVNRSQTASADSLADAVRALSDQVRALQASMADMRSESEQARAETRKLRRELDELRAGSSERKPLV